MLKKLLAIAVLTGGFALAVKMKSNGCCSGPPECPPVCSPLTK